MSARVNMHSGASTFNYPFELPTGPSGFQPKLELIYNSGSVDEMKNKRAVGSWVGIEWVLFFTGRPISFDPVTWAYTIGLEWGILCAGTKTMALYIEQILMSNLKITRNGNTWEVWDKDGNYVEVWRNDRFTTVFSDFYLLPVGLKSLQKDTNNNQAMISYVRDITGTSPNTWVRSAYPEYMTYGNFQVHFLFFREAG